MLHPGPLDDDGQRTWVLEDPVRGNNYQLGYVEGEILYRLTTIAEPDEALSHLYATTPLRPTPEETSVFIKRLQNESLAILPKEEVIRREMKAPHKQPDSLARNIMRGSLFYRKELLRPDRFLTKALPWLSFLWSPVFIRIYIICGLVGAFRVLQEIDLYFGTVSYLFTPQGGVIFLLSLVLLKIGHEFAHAFSAKSMGLHVRSMGLFFIVIWPLLYTDTTDVWKIPDRKKRMKVSIAGVAFELAVAGVALLIWSMLSDGILRSIMFFLSSTSLITSALINLNPFMRYDGYYFLMDYWGVDNLRPRSLALLRHAILRALLDWKAPAPEIHPNSKRLIFFGFLSLLYRLFIFISIALAVYYLLFPALGLAVFIIEMVLFIFKPLRAEIRHIQINSRYIGSGKRILAVSGFLIIILLFLIVPIPSYKHVPCLVLYEDTSRIEAPEAGKLVSAPPERDEPVDSGSTLAKLESDALIHELRNVQFSYMTVHASRKELSSGGKQGAHRNWLLAEEDRLMAEAEKIRQAIAQLEIKAPLAGKVVDVNEDLYEGAYVERGTYLLTVTKYDSMILKAFVHEKDAVSAEISPGMRVKAVLPGIKEIDVYAVFRKKSAFPVHYLPNDSLLDVSGGPIVSVEDAMGRRPRDAYFPFVFDIKKRPDLLPNGLPSWIWLKTGERSVIGRVLGKIRKHLTERGLF